MPNPVLRHVRDKRNNVIYDLEALTDDTMSVQGRAADAGAVGEVVNDITEQKAVGGNVLPPESVSGYWDTSTGEAVENQYMIRTPTAYDLGSGKIYCTTKSGFKSCTVVVLFLDNSNAVLGSKTFSSDGNISIPTNTVKYKAYINGIELAMVDVCLSLSDIQYEAYNLDYFIKESALPNEYFDTISDIKSDISAIENTIDDYSNKIDRIGFNESTFDDVVLVQQTTALYTNGAWQSNGTIATTTAALKYNAIDLIDVVPGETYLLNRFYGYYLLFDSEGKNGTQSDVWTSYTNVMFTVPEGKTKIGINVSATHFPSAFYFTRITPISTENQNLKTTVKILNGQNVVVFGDSIIGNYRGVIGSDMSIPAMIAELTGATAYNAGFGGCRMAEHPTTYWDAFSMYQLANSIKDNSWTVQDTALVSGSGELPNYFTDTVTMLKGIDWNNIDIIVIAYGTNDFTGNVSESDFKSALADSISDILSTYSHLKIIVVSPMYRWYENDDSDTHTNSNNNTLMDFCEWCETVSKQNHVPYCDTYYNTGINQYTKLVYFDESDGTHPNVKGRWTRASIISAKMNEVFY